MLNKIGMVIRRLEQRVASKESALQKLQLDAASLRTEIAASNQQRTLMLNHLASMVIAGANSLEAILEHKARQASLQRKLAELDLFLADKTQQLEEVCRQQAVLRTERNQLQRKAEKMTNQLQLRRKQQAQRRHRLSESETEEQLNWQL